LTGPLLALCLLAGPSTAEGTDNGLVVRILPVADATVGAPIELRVLYENTSERVLWVVGKVHWHLILEYSSRGRLLHGQGGSPPRKSSLVKLEPGATLSLVDSIAPPLSGRAAITLTLSNREEVVREARTPTNPRPRTVALEGLWRGSVHLRLPITIRKSRGLGSHQRDADLAAIRGGKRTPTEAVHKWTEWATSVPDERLVDALRARLRMPDVRPFERMACIGQLAVTVHQGFGLSALPDLVAIAGNADAPPGERVMALEALVVGRRGVVDATSWKRGVMFSLDVPDDVQKRAAAALDELADGETPELQRIAKRIRDAG